MMKHGKSLSMPIQLFQQHSETTLIGSPQSGFTNLSVIPTSIIEAVEVYPDFTPVQLSDGNLAGAINIRTRKIENGNNGGKVSATYGSFNTRRAELSSWLNHGNSDLLIAASAIDSDNDFTVDPDDLSPGAGESTSRQNAAFKQNDLYIKMRNQLNEQFTLQSVLNHSESKNELPTLVNKKLDSATIEKDLTRAEFMFDSTKDNQLWGVRVFAYQNDDLFSDPDHTTALTSQIIDQQLNGIGSTLHYEIQLNNHQISTSLNASESEIKNLDKLDKNEKVISKREKITAAISDTWTFTPALSLQAIYRLYDISDEAKIYTIRPSNACDNGTIDCGDSNHNETSWQLGIAHKLNSEWQFKANTGQFIRIPTLSEKFGNFGNYLADPELKPEESFNTDIGVLFNNNYLQFQATGFYKEIKNGIFIEYDTSGTGHPDNIAKSGIAGIEGALSWKLHNNWTMDFSGHAMDSKNKSDNKGSFNQLVFGIYHFSYFSSLTWHDSQHSASLSYQVDDELSYNRGGKDMADKKSVTNFTYTLFLKSWSINLSVNNLFDDTYSDYSYMPTQGRSYFTTINYEFN